MQIGSVDAEYMDINSREKLLREEEKERKMKEKVLCVPAGLSLENFERNVNERSVFLVRKYAEKNFTFKVEARRAVKSYPVTSMEICRDIGAHLLDTYPFF